MGLFKITMYLCNMCNISIIAVSAYRDCHVSRIVSTREVPSPTSYLLPESTEFCLNDLCVVPSRLDTDDVTCAPVVFSIVFFDLRVLVCWLAVLHHVLAPFCACFFPQRDAPQDSTWHNGDRTFIRRQSLKTRVPHICYLLSLLLCGVEIFFFFLTKSEKNGDLRFVLVAPHEIKENSLL